MQVEIILYSDTVMYHYRVVVLENLRLSLEFIQQTSINMLAMFCNGSHRAYTFINLCRPTAFIFIIFIMITILFKTSI